MARITLEEFCRQWDSPDHMNRNMDRNIEDFINYVKSITKSHFLSSFDKQAFAGGGPKWEPRRSRWGKKHNHDLLVETGKMKHGLNDDHPAPFRKERNSRGLGGRLVWDVSGHYSLTTVGKSGRRGGGHYAAVHNTDPKLGLFRANGKTNKPPVHRQFMGISPYLNAKMNENIMTTLFRDLPKC